MEFPEAERVIYSKNPLAEVACQIRYPRILALDERIPAEFQSKLGKSYPFVETREVVQFGIALNSDFTPSKRVHYEFTTEDRAYTITLSSEHISIATRKYERWETFSYHINSALEALTQSYSVPLFTRVGLRYVDIISRSRLGLEHARWGNLIRTSALGLLSEDEMPISSVAELSLATLVSLDGGGKATIRTGLGKTEDTSDETVFIVDSDFFEENALKGAADAIAVCTRFNRSAGRAFRWIIRDELHNALGPQSPD